MEYNLIGKMLMEGLDVYVPLVDDHGVDCVIKKVDGTFMRTPLCQNTNNKTLPLQTEQHIRLHKMKPDVLL